MVEEVDEKGASKGRWPGAAVPRQARAIRQARLAQGLSLRALSARAGIPFSTLSKLENGKMALTYDKLIRLALALGRGPQGPRSGAEQSAPLAVGRGRSVTRAGEERDANSQRHAHHYPAVDLLGKMMVPIIIDIQARSVDEIRRAGPPCRRRIPLRRQRYDGIALGALCAACARPRRCVYFDSGMAHGYVRTSDGPCKC